MIRPFSLRLTLPLALVSLTFVLAIDRASTPIVIERLGDGNLTIKISGVPGKHYRIEASNVVVFCVSDLHRDPTSWKARAK